MQDSMEYKANILVVDDTPDNLLLLVWILEKQGHKVIPASSGKQTLTIVQEQKIDLILLDIMMPEMDGYEVCRKLKIQRTTRNIPVIFLSALSDTLDKVKAFKSGGVDYITKPFQTEEILARVNTHIKIYRLQRELEARNRELAKLVKIDGLTQIANRRYFESYLNKEWKRLAREKKYLSLIFIDIDHFKLYNDYYGHQAGDKCLKQLARVFDNAAKRPADLAARYGGEEFTIILPDTDEAGAKHIAGTIKKAISNLNIAHSKSKVRSIITCSMGIVSAIPEQGISLEKFVALADKALYCAKSQGRNRIVIKNALGECKNKTH